MLAKSVLNSSVPNKGEDFEEKMLPLTATAWNYLGLYSTLWQHCNHLHNSPSYASIYENKTKYFSQVSFLPRELRSKPSYSFFLALSVSPTSLSLWFVVYHDYHFHNHNAHHWLKLRFFIALWDKCGMTKVKSTHPWCENTRSFLQARS